MKKAHQKIGIIAISLLFSACADIQQKEIQTQNGKIETKVEDKTVNKTENLKLGAFSISLSVKNLQVSKEFYEKMGFTILGGSMESNYLIMKNENTIIGLFQGMFEGNMLTFNPGWDENAKDVENFDDIRVIQNHLMKEAILAAGQIDSNSTGPASLMVTDPDGNMILIDQHR